MVSLSPSFPLSPYPHLPLSGKWREKKLASFPFLPPAELSTPEQVGRRRRKKSWQTSDVDGSGYSNSSRVKLESNQERTYIERLFAGFVW